MLAGGNATQKILRSQMDMPVHHRCDNAPFGLRTQRLRL